MTFKKATLRRKVTPIVLPGKLILLQLSVNQDKMSSFLANEVSTIQTHHEKKLTNIYLIGPMGAGKTSVGKQIAKLTKCLFYDSDQEIEKRTGADIPWIFKMEWEIGFRRREREMIDALCKLDNIILATGGGAVLNENNRRQLCQNGIVIYLTTTIETQLKRVRRKEEIRPLFLKNNSQEKLQELNEIRKPLYQAIADLIYPTSNLNPRQLGIQILADIKKNYLRR